MRTYELMLVLAPSVDPTAVQTISDLVKKIVGETVAVSDMIVLGKKRLAYPIKKKTEGVYVVMTLSGNGIKTGDIEKQTRLNETVIRYLLTVKA